MSSRRPLPPRLGDRFSVREARASGVSRSRLRNSDLEAPFHGVRAFREPIDGDVLKHDRLGRPLGTAERAHLARALSYATRMPDFAFFSHVTAAVIWGLPLPASAVRSGAIHVAVPAPHRLPRGNGVRGHEILPGRDRFRVDEVSGLRVATPVVTWAMLGASLRDPYDLVAAGDGVVRDWRVPERLATLEELGAADKSGRRVGIVALRAALPRVRSRSASRTETWTRLSLIDAGLPEPELNYAIHRNGILLATVDLAYPQLKIAIEYEGEHHLLDPEQWARDIARYDALREMGWHVVRVTKAELFSRRHDLTSRVAAAISARS